MLRPVIDAICGLSFVEDFLDNEFDITVAPTPPKDDGFMDWFATDVSGGFKVWQDDELAHELQYKASQCYPRPLEASDVLTMFFYHSSSAKNIEVNYKSPYHEKLVKELRNIPDTGRERTNTLARIRYAAKKIGLKTTRGNPLATDIRVVWRNAAGQICG